MNKKSSLRFMLKGPSVLPTFRRQRGSVVLVPQLPGAGTGAVTSPLPAGDRLPVGLCSWPAESR